MLIGHIKEIMRYPVKSFTGEKIMETKVMKYGLYGDRSHGFLDKTRKGKFLTITQFPQMVQYKARFIGEELEEKYPKVEIITPEGQRYNWGDERLKRAIENKAKRKLSMISFPPTDVPLGAIEVENLLLVTDASLNKLMEMYDNTEIDYRRFRPNILISLEDKVPFIEEQWIGRRLIIGNNVELELTAHCERCMIITVDPESGDRDPTLLKTIAKERNNHFGVFASVIKTGKISVGDPIYLRS